MIFAPVLLYCNNMPRQNAEKILLAIVKVCLYLTVFAPLILSAKFFFPAIFPKAVYIRLLIEIALVAYVPLAIMVPRYRPRYNRVLGSLAIFALVVVAAAIFGENFRYSLWGNYERMDGIFSWAHYWVMIVIAASILKEKRDWLKLFSASLGAAVAMSVYGFFQRFGVDHFGPWTIYETNLGRITGTIGNPAFLAVYLLFNITFALLIITDTTVRRWWKLAATTALLPVFAAYMMTGVRGAFIGFVLGTIIFFVGSFLWFKNRQWRITMARALLGFILVLGVLYALVGRNTWVTQNFGRVFSIPLQDSTVQTRLVSWRGALQGIKENFWLGVGPQKFDVVFNQYFDPSFYTLVGNETWWDRAHNMVLEIAATMGIIGLLAYLGVGGALLYTLWQLGKQRPEQRIEVLIIMAFLAAYFIQNLFVFDTISSYIVLTLLVGYMAARANTIVAVKTKLARVMGVLGSFIGDLIPVAATRRWWFGLAGAALIIGPIAYNDNIKLIVHNRRLLDNIAYQFSRPLPTTIANYRKIFEISDFDDREVAIKLAQFLGQYTLSNKITLNDLRSSYTFAISAADKVIAKNPKDVRLLLAYANSLNVYAELLKQPDSEAAGRVLRKAEGLLQVAANLGKARQQVFHSLANTYLIAGDTKRGIDTLLATIQLDPNTPTTYWLLSFAYLQAGEKDRAIEAALAALDKNYSFSNENETQAMAAVLAERKEYEFLLRLYQKAANDTGTGTAQAKVAAILAQMGKKDEARQAAQEVLRRDPSLKPQVDDFLKKLASGARDFIGE